MMKFEEMSDDEFNAHLCDTVATLDQYLRENRLVEPGQEYRKYLAEADRICMDPVTA